MVINIKAEYDTKNEFDTVLIALRDFIVSNKKCKANLSITKRQEGYDKLGLETVDMEGIEKAMIGAGGLGKVRTWSTELTDKDIKIRLAR